MQRRTKTILLAVVLATTATLAFTSSWFQRVVAGARYERIADGVYADPRLSDGDRRRALADLQAARERIAAMFGTPRARPTILIAANDGEARSMGLADRIPGSAFITPLDTRVVLNMAHFSIDVTAHELMHAELADRLGFWTRMLQLPVWFDEGLALQLDWRSRYQVDCAAVGAARIHSVRSLSRVSQFWNGSEKQIVANYHSAKCAVAQALERHPPAAIYEAMGRLRGGENFEEWLAAGAGQ